MERLTRRRYKLSLSPVPGRSSQQGVSPVPRHARRNMSHQQNVQKAVFPIWSSFCSGERGSLKILEDLLFISLGQETTIVSIVDKGSPCCFCFVLECFVGRATVTPICGCARGFIAAEFWPSWINNLQENMKTVGRASFLPPRKCDGNWWWKHILASCEVGPGILLTAMWLLGVWYLLLLELEQNCLGWFYLSPGTSLVQSYNGIMYQRQDRGVSPCFLVSVTSWGVGEWRRNWYNFKRNNLKFQSNVFETLSVQTQRKL